MARKPSKKREHNQISLDSDENFAYIAGYTAGGAPYGVTWGEQEATESSDAAPLSCALPIQAEPVSLNDMVQEMRQETGVSGGEQLFQDFRFLDGNGDKGFCGAGWCSAPLLPLLESAARHAGNDVQSQ